MTTVSDLSDVNLDAAFAASYDAKAWEVADYYGAEIRERLTSAWSFVSGMTGAQRFPKFEARLNFSQSEAAQKSLQQSAGAVLDDLGGVLKTGGFALAVAALAAVAIYAAVK